MLTMKKGRITTRKAYDEKRKAASANSDSVTMRKGRLTTRKEMLTKRKGR